MNGTYIDQCLREEHIARWPDKAMPIKVYVAPFRWYEKSKQMESNAYQGMVLQALEKWAAVSNGKIAFRLVSTLNDSQMDISWRRVDRKSLGHCEYLVNKNYQIYSAEIKIGISDGLLHAKYNDMDEVNHTILHEIGHALGILGHSPYGQDIMYVPHKFGVTDLSETDKATLQQIYNLPVGFNWQKYAARHQLPTGSTIYTVLDHLKGKSVKNKKSSKKNSTNSDYKFKGNPKVLDHHHSILTQMGKFHLATQNIHKTDAEIEEEE